MTTTYTDAKNELRNRLADYLLYKGINLNKPFSCLAGTHEDKSPSMSYDKKRNKVHCFSCNADMDIIDLIKVEYGLNDADAFKKGYELFNINVAQNYSKSEQYVHNEHNGQYEHNEHTKPRESKYTSKPIDNTEKAKRYAEDIKNGMTRIKETSYFKGRGLSEAVIERFKLGYTDNFYFVSNTKGEDNFNAPAVIIPTTDNTYVARSLDTSKKTRYNKRGTMNIFNLQACNTKEPIVVTEGEIDAMSIIELGHEAIGLGSVNNVDKLLKHLDTIENKPILILNLDQDGAGAEGTQKLIAGLEEKGIKYIEGNLLSGECKDANEMLQKNKEAFKTLLANATEEAIELRDAEFRAEQEAYKSNYASSYIKDFLNGIKEKANTPYIPTGFEGLDKTLDGGLFEGLYFIGAISSLGKTTFTLQVADQIAKSGQDVIIFSLEMARSELIAKSLSRQTLLLGNNFNNAKTTRGITTYTRYPNYSTTEIQLINDAVKSYSDYSKNIVIVEGQGDIGVKDIREAIEKHIRLTGNKPVVVIDYLQILAPFNDRATDKQNTDKAVTELKRISRDNKLSIIAISSLNRDNYNAPINMGAFKESGAIEYSSDVLIGLQFKGQGKDFNIDEAKAKSNNANSPRELELVILKNRNGRTGDKIPYSYYPLFNYFKEGEIF